MFMILTMKGAQVKEKAKEAFKYAAFLSWCNSFLRIWDTWLKKDFSHAYNLRTWNKKKPII